ncbi:phosphotransferase family protein [Streptomyces sp. NPDC088725]|uniref:phosphotransferase family protein n=1 Tax=Streptomyces sp. NPDC088725 TaxID=3365873 RepID=UPI0038012FBD
MSAAGTPAFTSIQDHVSRLGDTDFWWPYVAEILDRHGLRDPASGPGPGRKLTAGTNGTYPTFLYGDLVVKLFGYSRAWRESHTAERAAQTLIATDPEIAAPRLLGEGRLYEDDSAPWPYLITTRMPGIPWREAELSRAQQIVVAADLGRQVHRVHALRPSAGSAPNPTREAVTAAAEQSSLPPHLTAQVDTYLAQLGPYDPAFVHGDLTAQHVFVENGRLTGIIDWGDATVTDRHYEIGQLHRALFNCDKTLLRAFLEAAEWPASGDFPRQCLGLALHRQAAGIAQHHSFDLFEPIAALFPLQDLATLDALAAELFAV